jgi:hypothetical protein
MGCWEIFKTTHGGQAMAVHGNFSGLFGRLIGLGEFILKLGCLYHYVDMMLTLVTESNYGGYSTL